MIAIFLCWLTLVTSLLNAAPTPPSNSNYTKVASYSGSTFFDNFDAFTGPDPTWGFIDYVDLPTAAANNLTAFTWCDATNETRPYIGVDHTNIATTGRKSVRLTSKDVFQVGMLTVIDVYHAPTGPGVWPAVWLLANVTGDTWPVGGEQDIMEWVNDATANSMTLHTAAGCSVDNDPRSSIGTLSDPNCNSGDGDEGCSIVAPDTCASGNTTLATAGAPFNAQGGGVYVHEWSTEGVSVWLFPRSALPADLAAGQPNPSTWIAKPLAKFCGSGCDFSTSLQQMQLIINIDICGQWAGQVWDEMGMAAQTGVATCDEYAANNPAGFSEAYFEFGGIEIYSSGSQPAPAPPGRVKRSEEEVVMKYIETAVDEDSHSNEPRHWHGHRHGSFARKKPAEKVSFRFPKIKGPGGRKKLKGSDSSGTSSGASRGEVAGYSLLAGLLLIAAMLV